MFDRKNFVWKNWILKFKNCFCHTWSKNLNHLTKKKFASTFFALTLSLSLSLPISLSLSLSVCVCVSVCLKKWFEKGTVSSLGSSIRSALWSIYLVFACGINFYIFFYIYIKNYRPKLILQQYSFSSGKNCCHTVASRSPNSLLVSALIIFSTVVNLLMMKVVKIEIIFPLFCFINYSVFCDFQVFSKFWKLKSKTNFFQL